MLGRRELFLWFFNGRYMGKARRKAPKSHARNLILHTIRYKAQIKPKKDKDMSTVTQCVEWRTQTHEQENLKKAAMEERKR